MNQISSSCSYHYYLSIAMCDICELDIDKMTKTLS